METSKTDTPEPNTTVAAPAPTLRREKSAPYKATERLFYRNPVSRDQDIRYGKFFAIGDPLEGVDPAHLKDMEVAGQASNKPVPEPEPEA